MLHIGTLGKPHGIKGAISILSKTDPLTLIFEIDLYTPNGQPFIIKKHEVHHKKIICYAEQIPDRNASEAWRYTELFCDKDSFFDKHPEQIMADLCEGYSVLNQEHKLIGTLQDVIILQHIQLLVVTHQDQLMHLPTHIKRVDHQDKTITLSYTPE